MRRGGGSRGGGFGGRSGGFGGHSRGGFGGGRRSGGLFGGSSRHHSGLGHRRWGSSFHRRRYRHGWYGGGYYGRRYYGGGYYSQPMGPVGRIILNMFLLMILFLFLSTFIVAVSGIPYGVVFWAFVVLALLYQMTRYSHYEDSYNLQIQAQQKAQQKAQKAAQQPAKTQYQQSLVSLPNSAGLHQRPMATYCPNCGSGTLPTNKFCKTCGNKL